MGLENVNIIARGIKCFTTFGMFPTAKLIAVEPEASNFALLKKNTRNIDIKCIQSGIWWRNAKLTISKENIRGARWMDFNVQKLTAIF